MEDIHQECECRLRDLKTTHAKELSNIHEALLILKNRVSQLESENLRLQQTAARLERESTEKADVGEEALHGVVRNPVMGISMVDRSCAAVVENDPSSTDGATDEPSRRGGDGDPGGLKSEWKRRSVLGNLLSIDNDIAWAIYTKVIIEMKAVLISLIGFSIAFALFLKDHGIIDMISHVTLLNRCFLSFAITKHVLWSMTLYGTAATSLFDPHTVKLRLADSMIGTGLSLVFGRYVFPNLCGRHMEIIGEREVEVSPSFADKTSIFFVMFAIGYVTDVLKKFLFDTKDLVLPGRLSTPSRSDDNTTSSTNSATTRRRRSLLQHVVWSFKDSLPGIVVNYILFGLVYFVLFLSSSQVHKDPYVEIFVFGYLFPIIKQITVWGSVKYAASYCNRLNHSGMRRAAIIGGYGAAATAACTISQMYIIAISSNDWYLFCMQVYDEGFRKIHFY